MASKDVLDWLKNANATLEQLPNGILSYFDAIAQLGEKASQTFVDGICEYAAWMVNITVERIRQRILEGLYEQNTVVRVITDTINIGKKVIQDPLGTIASFFSTITSPFTEAIKFAVELIQELAKLAGNLAKIASALPPAPPNPQINYDKFQLKLGDISMGALGSADSLPEPEVIFPRPENPFGKNAFKKAFAEGKKASETNDVKEFKEKMAKVKAEREKTAQAKVVGTKAAMEGEIV